MNKLILWNICKISHSSICKLLDNNNDEILRYFWIRNNKNKIVLICFYDLCSAATNHVQCLIGYFENILFKYLKNFTFRFQCVVLLLLNASLAWPIELSILGWFLRTKTLIILLYIRLVPLLGPLKQNNDYVSSW